jgi:hypothetical protein
MRRRSLEFALVALAALPAAAAAHGDVPLVRETVTLGPGESVRYLGHLHYHRLVGRVSADGPVVVRLVDAHDGSVAFERESATRHAFSELIACCDHLAWADYFLEIENAGPGEAVVSARVVLVHDDLAVMVWGTESGTRAAIVILGLLWAGVLWLTVRSRARPARLARAAAAGSFVWALPVALLVLGAARYGGGGVGAFIAGLSDLPVLPWNPIVSRVSILLGLAGIAWGTAGVLWARSGPGEGRGRWLAIGAALVAAVGATAILVILAYGDPWIPAIWTAVAIAPMLGVLRVRLHEGTGG